MELKVFLGYLAYRYCEEIENHRLYYVYELQEEGRERGRIVSITKPKSGYLERETMYLICTDLGIDMPEKFKDYQAQMDRIWTSRAPRTDY
ncbi:MAG: hypothetical protein EOO60_05430 [Hymenobacter sp.]|nr:MAG: hypothetical protein EOO60_05430 [Hymenobacter sp.]